MKYFAEEDDILSIKHAFESTINDLYKEEERYRNKINYLKADRLNRENFSQPTDEINDELLETQHKLGIIKYVLDNIINARIEEYDITLEEEES